MSKTRFLPVLLENGLTRKQALVYLAMIELGEAPASAIARLSSLKRPTTYLILEELVAAGLATHSRRNRGLRFRALNPYQLLEQREYSLKRLRDVAPALTSLSHTQSASAEMRVYEGVHGVRQIMEDTLSAKGGILCWADIGLVTTKVFKKYWTEYIRKRVERRIYVRAIFSNDDYSQRFHQRDRAELRESVLIPKNAFPLPGEMNIYNDKVAIISYEDLLGVVIQNPTLAQMQRSIFEFSFRSAKQIQR